MPCIPRPFSTPERSLLLAGQIKYMLDTIIDQRSKGVAAIAYGTKTKLILKGLNPDRFNAASPDDPAIVAKVRAVAQELGINL